MGMNLLTLKMMNYLARVITLLILVQTSIGQQLIAQEMAIARLQTLPEVGAAQGVSQVGGQVFVYGDREVGMMRRYLSQDSLTYSGDEYLFTVDGKDLINHPTGIAHTSGKPTFIGILSGLTKKGRNGKQ